MDCVQWTPVVYNDLLCSGDGTGRGLVMAYFNTVGWPLSTATSERGTFAEKILQAKQKAFLKLIEKDGIPLRLGVVKVLQNALADGAKVVLIGGTQSEYGVELTASALRQLPQEVAAQVRTFSINLLAEKDPAPSAAEAGSAADIMAQLRSATAGVKQQQLNVFVQSLTARDEESEEGRVPQAPSFPVNVDPNLVAVLSGTRRMLEPSFLAAVAATLSLPLSSCLFCAGTTSALQAAASAGMAPVIIPRRFAGNGQYDDAVAKFEGYEGGQASWPRLRNLIQ
ncbi:MAG: hypothetical protein WDW38_002055 [Sanguina aurantia]